MSASSVVDRVHEAEGQLREAQTCRTQLVDMCDGSQSALLARSAFGLVKVYNLLPQDVIDRRSVKLFQKALQTLVKDEMECCRPNWDTCLSTVYGGAFLSRRQG